MESITRTQDELVAELRRRFGDDPMNWAFQCPACKDIATAQDWRDALPEGQLASDRLGQLCIGRQLGALREASNDDYTGRGCDWAAGGLFRGPDFVEMPDGTKVPSFPIAPPPEGTGSRE
jgi:hypothetical protein